MTETELLTDRSAHGFGLATITDSGAVLDVWFPAPALGTGTDVLGRTPEASEELTALAQSGTDTDRGVTQSVVFAQINLDAEPDRASPLPEARAALEPRPKEVG